MKKKPPNFEKIKSRIILRFDRGDLDSAIKYGVSVVFEFKDRKKFWASFMELPDEYSDKILDECLNQTKRKELRRVISEKSKEVKKRLAEKNAARIQGLRARLNSCRRRGEAEVFLASLTDQEKREAEATDREFRGAIEIRKTALRTSGVLATLGCTLTELNRWSEDGRLPVLFKREIELPTGLRVEARLWSLESVQKASEKVERWRQEDRDRIAQRRREAALRRHKKGDAG